MVSCDGRSSLELFCSQGDGQEMANWVEAIQSNIRCLNQREAQRMSDAICLNDTVSICVKVNLCSGPLLSMGFRFTIVSFILLQLQLHCMCVVAAQVLLVAEA